MREAADKAGCDVALALAEIQETWDAIDSDDAGPWHHYYEEEEDDEEEDVDDDAEEIDDSQYVLQDLINSDITLGHWVGPDDSGPEEISLTLTGAEVAATPSADLTPYASEYEGYMGNYDNTLDRWYQRAALIIWPRNQDFANRAQASSLWALDQLLEMIQAGDVDDARDAAESLAPFWKTSIHAGPRDELLAKSLEAAKGLADAASAGMLLRPFRLEWLAPGHAPALAELAERYGDTWTGDLLREWTEDWRRGAYVHFPDLPEWLPSFPLLCAALTAGGTGATTARVVVKHSWEWLAGQVRPLLSGPPTSSREKLLIDLGRPLAAVIAAAAQTGTADVLEDAVNLGQADGDQVISLVMAVLRAAEALPADVGHGHGFDELAAGCAERIRTSLARPQRGPDDWSIEPSTGCPCELCETLDAFLRHPERRAFEWPLAQAKRAHVHSRIDGDELPVRHETRRQGRPYTLVLTKTKALFEQERRTRSRHEADLAWLTDTWKAPA